MNTIFELAKKDNCLFQEIRALNTTNRKKEIDKLVHQISFSKYEDVKREKLLSELEKEMCSNLPKESFDKGFRLVSGWKIRGDIYLAIQEQVCQSNYTIQRFFEGGPEIIIKNNCPYLEDMEYKWTSPNNRPLLDFIGPSYEHCMKKQEMFGKRIDEIKSRFGRVSVYLCRDSAKSYIPTEEYANGRAVNERQDRIDDIMNDRYQEDDYDSDRDG